MAKLTKYCRKCGEDSWEKNGYSVRCSPCKVNKSALYYQKNKESINKRTSEYQKAHKEQTAAHQAAYRKRHPEKVKEWKENNKHLLSQYSRQYQARKVGATPAWVDEDEQFLINEVYELRVLREKLCGLPLHVDHIIPLKGETVCGLHVPNNLQLLTVFENTSKGNSYR